jgi:hypothetical protein
VLILSDFTLAVARIPFTVFFAWFTSCSSRPVIVRVASFSGLFCVTSILHLNWSDHRLMFALKRPNTSPTSYLGEDKMAN